MYLYQKKGRYFAQTAPGIEDLSAAELTELGANETSPTHRGLYFTADPATLYRINYQARTISRVLAPLADFPCPDADALYREAKKISWNAFFGSDRTFAVFANVSESRIDHSKFAALKLKDAIVDQFRAKFGKRPSVDTHSPDAWISLHVRKDYAAISFDLSGGPLHRRGYRKASMEAPMQETLAATIVRLSEWNGERPLVDPFCGTGTLLAEALMSHCAIPAGYLRKRFGFEMLPDFDAMLWRSVKAAADGAIRPPAPGMISGSDECPHSVAAAEMNLATLPHGKSVTITRTDFREIPDLSNRVIITNPPYGIRMGRREQMEAMIQEFGDFMKHRCKGSEAYLYFGERDMIKRVGLKSAWKRPLRNGGLDGRMVRYDLY